MRSSYEEKPPASDPKKKKKLSQSRNHRVPIRMLRKHGKIEEKMWENKRKERTHICREMTENLVVERESEERERERERGVRVKLPIRFYMQNSTSC